MRLKNILYCLSALVFFSCQGPDPARDAREVCDCFSKANSIPAEDPGRIIAQDKCSEMQLNKWSHYKDEEQELFNKALEECSEQLIKQALEEE